MSTEYNVGGVNEPKTEKIFVKLLNRFRDEYFKGNSPYDITREHLPAIQGVLRNILYKYNRPIGIVETGMGMAFGKFTMGVCTVYIEPDYRNQCLAKNFYTFIEQMAIREDALFNMQIEESSLKENMDKFIQLGFTHAYHIEEFDNGMEYNEKTYALFKEQHGIKELIPLQEIFKTGIFNSMKTVFNYANS
jgi:hypothetical protein